MKKFFYSRIAINNIKKNGKTYMPYIISSIVTVMMYYIMVMLSTDSSLKNMFGGGTTKMLLEMGVYVIAIFSAIFLFYSNSFLVKRRKKEFGLFNILGMEKRHISRIVAIETGIVFVGCTALGIILGVVFSKLVQLVLYKLINLGSTFGFEVSFMNILNTAGVFLVIYLLIFLSSMWQIHLTNPIDLLKGGQVGEREPKTRWIQAVLGIITLGAGYYIAITVESPIEAIALFFIAVILVIAGTEMLFVSGSTAILKLLRKNKKFYYKPAHFISVSGMIYRMKQNAVGLANICILSTMVLVMISSTVSLYLGAADAINNSVARDIIINQVDCQSLTHIDTTTKQLVANRGFKMSDKMEYIATMPLFLKQDGNTFSPIPGGIEADNMDAISSAAECSFMTVEEYNRITGDNASLADGHALLFTTKDETYNSIKVYDTDLTIDRVLDELPVDQSMSDSIAGTSKFYIVMRDMASVEAISSEIATDHMLGTYGFNIDCTREEAKLLIETINKTLSEGANTNIYTTNRFEYASDTYEMYGGLLFLGIFLGLLFIMATVQIIYYKQISEGHEDRERFIIMQNVGMNRDEVKRSIRSQVLTVFFLPLIVAGVHIAFAFSIITKMLAVLWLTNTLLFAICTIATFLVFALFYVVVYAMTARTYYKIVEAKPL